MRRFICLALIMLLAGCPVGCMTGPDYQRPAVNTPQSFRFAAKEAQDTANTTWWRQFQDPVLDRLITEALANNKNVQIAAANIEQAAGVLMQTRSPLFPQVNYSANAARERGSELNAVPMSPSIPNPQTSLQILAGANWEIDLWGRIRRLTEAARANLLASEEARRGVILSLVASVAYSYMQLRGLDEQLQVAKDSLAIYNESLRIFQLQFKHGQVPQLNVAQAQSQYETAAAAIPPLESQIAQTENAISILLGRNPAPIPRGKTIFAMTLPDIPAGLPSELLARRPDIRQSEQTLIAANAQIGAAKAQYFPSISLTAGVGAASADLSNLFQGPARVWSYAGSLTGPIFTAGAIAGQVQQAEAGHQAALLSYQAAIQNAFADVDNALIARQKTVEQLAAQARLVAALKEYSYFARLQYDAGYAAYINVLNAEQQLFPAKLNYTQTQASVLASFVKLYQAMGGGWVLEAEKMTEKPAGAATVSGEKVASAEKSTDKAPVAKTEEKEKAAVR
ncbi:MAG: efflux transporter outer membrane subunit [Deltaproteobacteria bacterium]|nr:efflux transporter outer membrane subunit [Deltaproteobacteria bacterium]